MIEGVKQRAKMHHTNLNFVCLFILSEASFVQSSLAVTISVNIIKVWYLYNVISLAE